jgi:hypothetical protein
MLNKKTYYSVFIIKVIYNVMTLYIIQGRASYTRTREAQNGRLVVNDPFVGKLHHNYTNQVKICNCATRV